MQISVANVQIVYPANATGYMLGPRFLTVRWLCLSVCVGSHWDNGRSRVWGLRIPIRYEAASEWSIRLCCRHDKTIKLNNSIDLCRKFNGIMLLLSSSFKEIGQASFVTWQVGKEINNLNTDFAYRVGLPSVNFHMICPSRTPLATCIRPRTWIPERITMLFIIGIIAACDRSVQLENLSIFE